MVQPGTHQKKFTTVYKFGGTSVADAARMAEVANIVCLFQEEAPVVVLSAMGKTTNNLIRAGEQALHCSSNEVRGLEPLEKIFQLHRETVEALKLPDDTKKEVEDLLHELQQLLVGVSLLKDLTPRSLDSLVSFGERLSTRIFAGYLRANGIKSVQHDAFELGVTTTDNFTDGDLLYELSSSQVNKNLGRFDEQGHPVLPVVTGFLGRGMSTGAITTLGRGGSDLTSTFLGAALGMDEVIVWKDVDGVLTTDPRVCPEAKPIPLLTVAEATELAYFGATVLHPQSMMPLFECKQDLNVRVRNSYNPSAPGSIICKERDMSSSLLSSIVLKSGVTLVDIVSRRMLGQYGFLSKVFRVFEELEISVDVVATSEVSVSVTLDPSKIWSRDLGDDELRMLKQSFGNLAKVDLQKGRSIISLIGNAERSCEILETTFCVLRGLDVNPEMISKGAYKNNIAMIVPEKDGHRCIQALHQRFF